MAMFGRSNLTNTRLPYLHLNARSRRITSAEAREVYVEEITRFLPGRVNREEYIGKVMP